MRNKFVTGMTALRHFLFEDSNDSVSANDEAILNSDRYARRFGYLLVLVVFGGFGIWAGLAPLESAAHGSGTVQVEGDRKPVQHLEGGIVAQILVANGDYVEQGQPLVVMDDTQAQAELGIVTGRLWAKRALVDRLLSERDGKQEIVFAQWLAAMQDERVLVAIGNEQALFAARHADLLGEKMVLRQRIAQQNNQITGVQAVLDAKHAVADSLTSEIADLNELLVDGYVDKQRIRQLERSKAEALGEISDLIARIAASEVSIYETELQILQLQNRFDTQVVDSLTRAEEELYDLEQRNRALSDRLERTVVRAPKNGVVLALEPNTIGAVVKPGSQLMSVVPDTKNLLIDTRLSPMDIDRIQIGQEAEVRFSVFKDAYSITGTLTKLSADALVDAVTGEKYFAAKIKLLEQDIPMLGDDQLVPGMPAEVLVKTGKRTLLGYLTSPMHRMFENAMIES